MFFELEVGAARFVEDLPLPLVLSHFAERWRQLLRQQSSLSSKIHSLFTINARVPKFLLLMPPFLLLIAKFLELIYLTLANFFFFLFHLAYDVFRREAWVGFWRFWFGLAYEIFGGLGSSVLRPAGWWIVSVFIAAMFYLGANLEMEKKRASLQAQGTSTISAYWKTSTAAWREGQACYQPEASADYQKVPEQDRLKPLPLKMRELTSAPMEALQLAFRTSFIVSDPGSDARSYGCLYGVLKSDSGMVYVPPAVSIVASVQKIVSAVLLFLFGLALRNLLKLK